MDLDAKTRDRSDLTPAAPDAAAGDRIAEKSPAHSREMQADAEAALRMSEARLRLAVEAANIGLWDWDLETNNVYYSPEWKSQIGYRDEEITNSFDEWQSRVHPEDLGPALRKVAAYLEDPKNRHEIECRFRHRDGSYRWIYGQGNVLRDAAGKAVRMLGCHIDITERKRAEEELRMSVARLRLSVEAGDVGLWDVDLAKNTVYYSPEWKGHIGYRDDEVGDGLEEWSSRLHPDERGPTEKAFADYLQNPTKTYEAEFRFRHKDGSYRWIRSQGSLLRDADGKPVRMLGCHMDITERKRAEEELHGLSQRLLHAEDAERRRIAKELHDSTAQDLVAVTMNLGLLQDSLAAGDTKAAQILADSVALVENCVNDIRTLSYVLHPPRLDEAGLAGVLVEYAAGFNNRTDTRIRIDVAADFGRLPENVEIALFRVVQEAVSNVLRHSHSDSATIRLGRTDDGFVIEIEDFGRGMADAGARGVGITGMRERLQHLGGRLEIESDAGGTIVRATLPLRTEQK